MYLDLLASLPLCIPPQGLLTSHLALPCLFFTFYLSTETCIVFLCFYPVPSSGRFLIILLASHVAIRVSAKFPVQLLNPPVSFVTYSVPVAPPLYPIPLADSHLQEPADLSCMHAADSEVTRARNAG
jgi:hypothetical protein